jgi:hypothetical protein
MNHNAKLAVDGARDFHHGGRLFGAALLLTVLCAKLAACSIAPPQADNARAMSDIAAHDTRAEEVVEGTVLRVLPNSNGPSGLHERFIVDVRGNGTSIALYVTDNISVGQIAPLHAGDHVVVKGELAFNDQGPLLHWTHRDPRMRHAPGFVEVGGHVYE